MGKLENRSGSLVGTLRGEVMEERIEEEEKRERSKESKEEQENTHTLSHTLRARTREELEEMARSIPTLEQVISHVNSTIGHWDEQFISEWYNEMCLCFWCDEYGNYIKNWAWVFNKWRNNAALFKKLRDPDRIPDARKGTGRGRKADNWRGTKKEDLGHALG